LAIEPGVRDRPVILHETATWLVVDKPAGWHSVCGATTADAEGGGVVESWLARARPELARIAQAGLLHRLDRDTSGCLVVARSPAARDALLPRLREGVGVRKTYLARVRPGIDRDGRVTLFFTSRYRGSARVTVAANGKPRHAGSFRWRVVARDDQRGDLVELDLLGPGRRHELRAGCAHLGHPLVGDALYGAAPADTVQLHAWRVELDGEFVEAPPPPWAETSHERA
jgi:23S rRNA pseudouridine1911/1915/1917 synthase